MIFVNFKTYELSSAGDGLELISLLRDASVESQTKIIPVVQATDVKEAVETTTLEIWAQHIDPFEYGAHTGSIIAEAVKEDGALGTFLNHSEHKFDHFKDLKTSSERASGQDLKTLIFAGDLVELEKVLGLKPTFAAYEPPELVGSKTTSVADSEPETIQEAVELTKRSGIPLVVGAGIKSTKDVKKVLELGAVGVAVASNIIKAEDPKTEIDKLLEGFN